MKRPIYTIFNILYQIVMCWVLMMLNAYYNDLVIPENLVHSSGKGGMKILILLLESAVLIFIIYAINSAVLSDTEDKSDRKAVANRTAKIHIAITLCFIAALMLS